MSKNVSAKVGVYDIQVGAPVHDLDGNVVGMVKQFKRGEDGNAEVVAEITDAATQRLVKGEMRNFSIGTKIDRD